MVGHFKERIADAFEHVEPWFISSVAFDPKKCQVDIHIDVRKTTDIVYPYYRRATPYYVYEPHRNLIASIENTHSNNVISRFDYVSDAIGRRIARVDSGEAFSETAFERYAYNNRSEVIGSQRFYGSDIDDLSRPVTGRTFGYGYDPIGNRVSSFEAATDATVTVNGNSAWRKGAYFVGVDDFDNVSSDVFAELATTAVRSTAEVDEIES